MERERADLTVEIAGRKGEVLRHSEDGLRVEVRFEDGETEWVEVVGAKVRERAQEVAPQRELGS